ncbi:DNA double-strand break repair nuclease NurA [Candidatus Woesearchaeota archaeon]|nr:DNA double-strand break repair nuclease NurA [Candidatus Woesearchaeota archaeon]
MDATHTSLLKEIAMHLGRQLTHRASDRIAFAGSGYRALPITAERYRAVSRRVSKARMVFVDGGQADLLRSPSFSLQFIRIAHAVYTENKRESFGIEGFYVLTTTSGKAESQGKTTITYTTKVFSEGEPPLGKEYRFDSFDQALSAGAERGDIGKVGSIVRRMAELATAERACRRLSPGDVVVIDGTLKATLEAERSVLSPLLTEARKRQVLVCGLSKSCSLLTERGDTAVALVQSLGPAGMWLCGPVAEITDPFHPADLSFARLHPGSRHAFRFEVMRGIGGVDLLKVVGMLAANAQDPVFLGYPYGLIDVDRLARVPERERSYLQARFMVQAGRGMEEIDRYRAGTDAHSILDSISF